MDPAGDVVRALLGRGMLVGHDVGPSLADVRRARVPLSDAEAVTVLVPTAETLDALHAGGLAYGQPGPGDIRFLPDGRPALVVPARWHDDRGGDLAGLLRTVLSAMTPPADPVGADDDHVGGDTDADSARYGDRYTDGDRDGDGDRDVDDGWDVDGDRDVHDGWDPDDDAGAGGRGVPDLRPVLERLLDQGCTSGAEVVRACFATADPEPVRVPDAGALARAALLGTPPSPSSAPAGAARRGALPGRLRPTGRRAVRQAARRRARRRTAVTVLAVVVVVGGVLLRPAADRAAAGLSPSTMADAGRAKTTVAALTDPVLDRAAPVAAAQALTRQRAALVAAGDAAGLVAVDAAGGPALDADEDLVTSLAADRLEGLSVDVQGARAVTADADEARVAVTSAMSPYRRVGPTGTAAVPGTAPRTVVLHLRWTPAGWRVWSVAEPSGA